MKKLLHKFFHFWSYGDWYYDTCSASKKVKLFHRKCRVCGLLQRNTSTERTDAYGFSTVKDTGWETLFSSEKTK